VRHQWQRQAGKVTMVMGAAAPTAGVAGVVAANALLVGMAVHGWARDAGAAATAAAVIDDGMASTASEAGAGEP
jgi:hypothetical protein